MAGAPDASARGTAPGAPSETAAPTQETWTARVRVTLKPVVNDPAGLSIAQALRQLGFGGVGSVRTGKYFEIEVAADDLAGAEALAERMCRALLANPVVERYAFSVGEAREA